MILLGGVMVLFIWGLFLFQGSASRQETLEARLAENRNLALIISENLKQMTDRAHAMASLVNSEQAASAPERLLTLLAKDPVFTRLAIYGSDGERVFASHPVSARPSIHRWLAAMENRSPQLGAAPVLPLKAADDRASDRGPHWRLPFLVPADWADDSGATQWILVELDIGYLAGLLQHVELGQGAFIQVQDANGDEWMRADSSGVIVDGPRVPKAIVGTEPTASVKTGAATLELAGESYQYVYAARPSHGFSIGLLQPVSHILAPLHHAQQTQLAVNSSMTLLVACIVIWLVRVLQQQQRGLQALQLSENRNQELIERLAGEHARSSRAASIDHLSGLYNRRQFMDVAAQALAQQRRRRCLSALLFIDLDRFKSINDSLGHHVGDLLLQAVAGRIQHRLGEQDIAARFGGDEFVILLTGDRTESDIEQWAAGLVQHLSAVYKLEGMEINNSPSVGIAISPRDGQNLGDLVRGADAAMYSAKKAGRGQYRFYDESLNPNNEIEEFHLEQSFADALRNHEFVLHYQPQVCLETMSIIGYETLVRWQHPRFGLLFPDRFIPLAEKTGFILALGLEVVRLACEQLSAWRDDGVGVHCLAVNVSPIQLAQPSFCHQVQDLMTEYGLAAGQLELEITETAILDAQAMDNLHCLKDAGIRLSLDDFGTGYSGLAHLEAVPVDKLKLDRSLIARICNSHDDSPVVSSTIILAKRMNLAVVAEGVETPEQLVHLKVAGCDIAQGYHLSRPMPATDVPSFINTFNRLQESA
jgi:diguanylate cyclase (GGDEF)-like protein